AKMASRVIGFDKHAPTAAAALGMGALSEVAASAEEAAAAGDLIVIATPAGTIPEVFKQIAPSISPGAVVTDVGSTKTRIVSEASAACPEGVHFIGGHPIAGSEKEGIEAATADLYRGCSWILTPTDRTDPNAYRVLMRFLSGLSVRVFSLDASRHDEVVALTSHLPQLLSSALMGFAAEVSAADGGLPLLSAGGFGDMTRIASSSPDLWVDIVRENRPALNDLLRRFIQALQTAGSALEQADYGGLRKMLEEGRRARMSLPGPGGQPGELIEILVPVDNRAGVLADVTTTVGEAGINIEDIDIIHSPEGGRGTVHLAVSGREPAEAAMEAIRKKGYSAELG
ncbi:MAG: prephenate dehydrogenase/arogenate dehydrogenase family protein, partial [Actinomycetota bacterium]